MMSRRMMFLLTAALLPALSCPLFAGNKGCCSPSGARQNAAAAVQNSAPAVQYVVPTMQYAVPAVQFSAPVMQSSAFYALPAYYPASGVVQSSAPVTANQQALSWLPFLLGGLNLAANLNQGDRDREILKEIAAALKESQSLLCGTNTAPTPAVAPASDVPGRLSAIETYLQESSAGKFKPAATTPPASPPATPGAPGSVTFDGARQNAAQAQTTTDLGAKVGELSTKVENLTNAIKELNATLQQRPAGAEQAAPQPQS